MSSAQTTHLMQKAASINRESLATAEAAVAGKKSPGFPALNKSGSQVPVYRFFNTQTTAHFYTISERERALVQATLPVFSFEGVAFYVSAVADTGLSPVHRFLNVQTGVHFYSISAEEKAFIEANLPQFHYEGVAYYASKVAGVGLTPLYRFFQSQKSFHFYTISQMERDNSIMFLSSTYQHEGVGYYVIGNSYSFEQSMLDELNSIRSQGGFGTLSRNAALDTAARNHGNYMLQNYRQGELWNGPLLSTVHSPTGWLTAHTETTGSAGFTGVLPVNRAIAAGFNTNYVAEVITPGYTFFETYPYRGCVDGLLSTVFHRSGLLYYGLREFGSAFVLSEDKFSYACIIEPAINPANNPAPPAGWVAVYPLPNQQNVATSMGDGSGEAPNPVPSSPLPGNPVSIYVEPQNTLGISAFELRDALGAVVPSKLLVKADFPGYLTDYMAYLVPLSPLNASMEYTARFAGTNAGAPLVRTWSFRTR
ncbi:hypothetical protein LPB72_08010 [Hydrogenophaga crassostreae]|uniref:Uncharacterized protein n=2 Tax=Hydrogenophaga crassostreae TaxID=1763535 RepID=A0A162P8E7_9BURK|nr:hypothetical protein LPB072_05430 [Hydrogenophaga crassostreae]OAD42430.1 hypothetical protein LPB72_08010 [Hydrogenophaga crassostreae]